MVGAFSSCAPLVEWCPGMPARVAHLLATVVAADPTVRIVYVDAISADAYFRTVEDGRTVFYVHPTHRHAVTQRVD